MATGCCNLNDKIDIFIKSYDRAVVWYIPQCNELFLHSAIRSMCIAWSVSLCAVVE
jgi:hypothetical protein